MRESRILERYRDGAAFADAARRAVKSFAFRLRKGEDGVDVLSLPGPSDEIRSPVPKTFWRPFKAKHHSLEGYEAPVVGLASFILHNFAIGTFYDVGAAVGFHTFIAASTEGKKVTVHAFEMAPRPYEALVKRTEAKTKLSGRIHAHLAGLSDTHEGAREVWYSRTHMFETKPDPSEYREAWHRRAKFAMLGIKNRDELKSVTLTLTSIDKFSETNAAPDFIKIDVDGYEGKVLKGAEKTLKTVRPFILLELHQDDHITRTGWTRKSIARYLFDLGYSALYLTNHYNVEDARLEPVDAAHPVWGEQRTCMFLFY